MVRNQMSRLMYERIHTSLPDVVKANLWFHLSTSADINFLDIGHYIKLWWLRSNTYHGVNEMRNALDLPIQHFRAIKSSYYCCFNSSYWLLVYVIINFVKSPNTNYIFSPWAVLVKLLSTERYSWTLLMASQCCFRQLRGALKHNAITWTNVYLDICRHVATTMI